MNNTVEESVVNKIIVHQQAAEPKWVERVALVAIPWISLHASAGRWLTVGLSAFRACQITYRARTNRDLLEGFIVAAAIYPLVAFPNRGRQLMLLIELAKTTYHFKKSKKKKRDAFNCARLALLTLTQSYRIPELMVAATSMNFVDELWDSYSEKRWPERISHLLMSIVKGLAVRPWARYTCLRWTTMVIEDVRPDQEINGRKYYSRFWFPSENTTFRNCDFSQCDLRDFAFKNVVFENCNFTDGHFPHSTWEGTVIANSNCSYANFYASQWKNVTAVESDFTGTSFNHTSFHNVTWKACRFAEAVFLGAEATESKMVDPDLTDCVLAGAKDQLEIVGGTPNVKTKPIVALGWRFRSPLAYGNRMYQILKRDHNVTILRYPMIQAPNGNKSNCLASEICTLIQNRNTGQSIAQYLVETAPADGTIAAFNSRAAEVIENSNALILPGGADIEPIFYGQSTDLDLASVNGVRRSILEIALLAQAHTAQIPVWGICRGAQLSNIFYGGTLLSHVNGQCCVNQLLQVDAAAPVAEHAKEIFSPEILGWSNHHQACDQMGEGLNVVLRHGSITKAFLSDDGRIMGTQFHPEHHALDNPSSDPIIVANKGVIRGFINKAHQRFRG